jgi:hypothetical protein
MTLNVASEQFLTVDEVKDSNACDACIDEATDDAEISGWVDQASDIIAILTGMRVHGRRQLLARPCRSGGSYHHSDFSYCDCCHLDSIPLGDQKPTIDEVRIDGEILPSDEYELHWGLNGWGLVRVGDPTSDTRPPHWPSRQKAWRPDTEEGTFSVLLTVGVDPAIPMIKAAMLELVCDLAAEAAGGYQHPNELPSGVTQATIGNATVQVDFDRLERMKRGEIGPNTSKLIAVYAPGERQHKAGVFAPELTMNWDLNVRVPEPVAS